MILATKSGMLTAVHVVRETPKAFIYNDLSLNGRARIKERRIAKNDPLRRLFNSTHEALVWMGESK